MHLNWSTVCCSVLLCYYCVQSGMLHAECICGGVANAGSSHSIYQSIIQKTNWDFTFLVQVPFKPSYELRHSPSQWVLNILQPKGCNDITVRWLCLLVRGSVSSYVHSFVAAPDFTERACACKAGGEKSQKHTNQKLASAPKTRWCVERTDIILSHVHGVHRLWCKGVMFHD
jgi:hypothetical protein